MFEKWRIKEHMEVTDSTGRHLGTVDEIEGDTIKLTRSDSADGQHHYVEIDHVDSIKDDRVTLKADAMVLTGPQGAVTGEPDNFTGDDTRPAPSTSAGYAGSGSETPTREDAPLFGTSGRGTGMGGSGMA